MHFAGETPLAAQDAADAVRTFWDSIKANILLPLVITIDPVGLQVVEESGLVAVGYPITTTPVTTTGGNEALPLQINGLVTARTGAYSNNREVKGRIFVPRPQESNSDAGAPNTAYKTALNTAAAALIADADSTWVVWQRPGVFKGTPFPGAAIPVVSATCQSYWSHLKTRRV